MSLLGKLGDAFKNVAGAVGNAVQDLGKGLANALQGLDDLMSGLSDKALDDFKSRGGQALLDQKNNLVNAVGGITEAIQAGNLSQLPWEDVKQHFNNLLPEEFMDNQDMRDTLKDLMQQVPELKGQELTVENLNAALKAMDTKMVASLDDLTPAHVASLVRGLERKGLMTDELKERFGQGVGAMAEGVIQDIANKAENIIDQIKGSIPDALELLQ